MEEIINNTEKILKTPLYNQYKGKIQYRLTNDYMFRAVMQKSTKVLKHLICSILSLPLEDVIDLVIQNPIELGKSIDSKTCILDIKVLLNNNQLINIEMQVSKQEYWKERSLTYLCRTYDNLGSGDDYDKVIPAIQISILDFNLFPNVEELISKYYLTNENPEYLNRYTNDFAIYVLNLHQIYNNKVIKQEQNSALYQWAKLFNAESWEEIQMLAEQNEVFDECVTTLAQLTEDEKIRMQCEARNDYIARQKGLVKRIRKQVTEEVRQNLTEQLAQEVRQELAKQLNQEVRQELAEQLNQEVRQELAKQLNQEVRQEFAKQVTQEVTQQVTQEVTQQVTEQVSIDLARKLLDVLDVETISQKTGLSIEQIKAL